MAFVKCRMGSYKCWVKYHSGIGNQQLDFYMDKINTVAILIYLYNYITILSWVLYITINNNWVARLLSTASQGNYIVEHLITFDQYYMYSLRVKQTHKLTIYSNAPSIYYRKHLAVNGHMISHELFQNTC